MPPDLEALILAYAAAREAPAAEAVQRRAEFESRIDEIVTRHPKLTREARLNAVRLAHRNRVRAQSTPPTLPPRA